MQRINGFTSFMRWKSMDLKPFMWQALYAASHGFLPYLTLVEQKSIFRRKTLQSGVSSYVDFWDTLDYFYFLFPKCALGPLNILHIIGIFLSKSFATLAKTFIISTNNLNHFMNWFYNLTLLKYNLTECCRI